VKQRRIIEQQIAGLVQKATQKPLPQDQMGMIGFASVLLAGQMQVLLFRADMEEKHELEKDGQ
jgi:hypothetical protein